MATFSEAAQAAVRAGVCSLIEPDPNSLALLTRLGLEDNALAAAATAFRTAFCNNNSEPGDPAGFSGGQCPTSYGVTVFYRISAGGTIFQAAGTATGPISRVFLRTDPAQQPIGIVANGVEGSIGSFSPVAPRPVEITSIDIVRLDGQADDCGDPGRVLPPPAEGPIVGPISITFDNSSGDETTFDGTLRIYAPVFAPSFSPRIPIRIDLGGISFNGDLNINGELNLELDFADGPGTDNGTPEPPEGDPPSDDLVIIGARVVVVEDTGAVTTTIFSSSRPNLYIPRAGVLQFLQPAGDSLAWSADIPIKTSPQWIACGPPGYAKKIAYTPSLGVTLEVTAILGRPPKG